MQIMRFFNTAGPMKCDKHYCIPPLTRFDLEEILTLIDQEKYFVLHAPRQTGKTTCLLALMDYLNRQGKYTCLYANVEGGQAARENVPEAMRAILSQLGSMGKAFLDDSFLEETWSEILKKHGGFEALGKTLTNWAEKTNQPIVLLLDEIDSLVGDTLISVLRQLRTGYTKRPAFFPQSIILCGVRDVRDYRIHSDREKTVITGGSAFNIKAKSLRLGNFTESEVKDLFSQHTNETGQNFEKRIPDLVWEFTCGQPWLVNALGYETCFEMQNGRDRSTVITEQMLIEAKKRITLRRETHIDQLVDKLKEPRVQRVISPMLQGQNLEAGVQEDDIQYVLDLGLVRRDEKGLQIANPIYAEVIPRELGFIVQLNLESLYEPSWYIGSDGRLEIEKLLLSFQQFFRENSEHWVERFDYKEAGPQLLLQAFLQRVINSGGRVEREYGLGRMRTDLLVIWSHPGGVQKVVLELKLVYGSLDHTIEQGLSQISEYMERCGTMEGHLLIFDRDPEKSWDKKIFIREESFQGRAIKIWGM
jgi:hypothetical protein